MVAPLPQYLVTRIFTGGILKGCTFKVITSTKYKVGQEVLKPCGGGSPYKIIAVVPVV